MDYTEFRERYRYDPVTDLLGQGGFGRVFRAHDTLLDRTVALKIFFSDMPEQYDLISEIRRAINLNHPNICRYYGAEVLRGSNALGEPQLVQVGIMEFVEGGTVGAFLANHPQHTRKLLIDVLRGLGYLHQRRPAIIHRDLKPPNVLVSFEDGVPVARITDFGISKTSRETGVKISHLIGTLAYMAPEQILPETYGVNGNINCNLDLWSFGVMTIELLTGATPFGAGDPQASTGQIQQAILQGLSEPGLRAFEEPYRSVLRRCMVPDAARRAQTAAELITLLEANPRRITVVEPIPIPNPPPPPKPVPVTIPVPPDPNPHRKRSRKWLWASLAAVLSLAILLAVTSFDGKVYINHYWVQISQSGARARLTKACEADDLSACSDAARMYDDDIDTLTGTLWDPAKAAYFNARAITLATNGCNQADGQACARLAEMAENGSGMPPDEARAADLYSKACDLNVAWGCSALSHIYWEGFSPIPRDRAKASQLLQKACSLDSRACPKN